MKAATVAFDGNLLRMRSAPGPPDAHILFTPALAPVSHCAPAENVVLPHFLRPRVMEHAALIRGGGRGHLHFLFAILYKNLMSYNLHMEDYFQTVRASDQASNWTHVVKYF